MPAEFIPLVALLIPIVVAPTAIVTKHFTKKRELLHRERMRALELGQPFPSDSSWPAALAAISIGAGVPIGSFGLAWLATMTTHLGDDVWGIACAVGLAGVIGGTLLGRKLIATPAARSNLSNLAAEKPYHDPEAYDVVSRRG